MIEDRRVLIFGGTGSLGTAFIQKAIRDNPKELIVFSRDEFKQYEMKQKYPEIKYILGDIRDRERVIESMEYVDIIINFAALKQVDRLEETYNVMEAVSTNVYGSLNIVKGAQEHEVEKVINISTDKCVEPCSTYGYTKAISERLFLDAGYSVARLGNVIPSRGCVIWYLKKMKEKGVKTLQITDLGMTRFWMEIDELPNFIYMVLEHYIPSRIYIPKLPAFVLGHLTDAMGFIDCEQIGMRAGERMEEILFSGKAWDNGDFFILNDDYINMEIRYTSNNQLHWLSKKEIKKRLDKIFK